jgi:hypothetical protein
MQKPPDTTLVRIGHVQAEVVSASQAIAPLGQLIVEIVDAWKEPNSIPKLVDAFEPLRQHDGQPNLLAGLLNWARPRLEPFAEAGGIIKELLPDLFPEPISKDSAFGHFLGVCKDVDRVAAGLRDITTKAAKDIKDTATQQMLAEMQEGQLVVSKMEALGYIPHGALWEHVRKIEVPSEKVPSFAEDLLTSVWPSIRPSLELNENACLGDKRLFAKYQQMLAGHEAGHYENVVSASVGTIERAVHLAKQKTKSNKPTFNWLAQEVGKLSSGYFDNGMSSFRVWVIITEHVFTGCHTDADANLLKYPNRNAVAHGIGSEIATKVASMNAILLAHSVITLIPAVERHTDLAKAA